MRVLVTGARGMLGHALGSSLPDGWQWLPTDVPELDITDEAAVAARLDADAPDAVINAAAYTNVDGCETDEDTALAVNGSGPGVLARACAQRGVPLVHVSTDYVFDGSIPAPGAYSEDDPVGPISAYGRTKLAGEQAVAAAGGEHWICRTQWLYGLDGANFVETMLRLAGERDELSVVDDQVGSPTSTHDLAPALWTFLERRPASGIYNVVNDGACSWFDFARAIFEFTGTDVRVAPTDSKSFVRPAPRPARSVLSTAKFQAAMGQGLRPWQDALADYIARRANQETPS